MHCVQLPLLVADYAFVRNSLDAVLLKLLVVRVYPFGLWFVTVVDRKGVDDSIIQRLADFITETGLVHYAYRSDREPATVKLFQEACRECGRAGQDVTPEKDPNVSASDGLIYDMTASSADIGEADLHEDEPKTRSPVVTGVPEHSHPGESASNGKAEVAVRMIVDHRRSAAHRRLRALRLSPTSTWLLSIFHRHA